MVYTMVQNLLPKTGPQEYRNSLKYPVIPKLSIVEKWEDLSVGLLLVPENKNASS